MNGKVTSTFSEDQELVAVVVVARDASGAIIAAESGYIDRLPTGGTAQFEVTFFDPLPATPRTRRTRSCKSQWTGPGGPPLWTRRAGTRVGGGAPHPLLVFTQARRECASSFLIQSP